jgi:hypothetical protein
LKIYTIDGWKYCAKNKCNRMIIVPRRHKDPSGGANRPSAVAVTVNINAVFNLSLIWWQWTHNWRLCKGSHPQVSSWAIVI